MSHPFYHLGWFFYRSGCSHLFFQGLYRTDNFWQQLHVTTLINTATYYLLFWKTLRKVYLFNHTSWSHPSFEVVVSVFVIERMSIIHSLKWTVPFPFVVPLLSLSVTIAINCHSLSFVVTRCTTRYHSLYHSLSFVVIWCTTRLSFYKWSWLNVLCNTELIINFLNLIKESKAAAR